VSKSTYILGAIIMAAFAVLMMFEMKNAATPYVMKVENVTASDGRPVQFKGAIVHNKTGYNRASHETYFTLTDKEGKTLKVTYDRQKPANFDTADVAVVRGVYRDGALKADRVSVKCPSKYKGN